LNLEIPLPNEQARLDILKIHAAPIAKRGDIGKTNSHFVFHQKFFF
jgi:ATP-dependent 26S proteasome regulatory subunit